MDPKCKKVLLMTEDGKVIDDAIKNFGKKYHFLLHHDSTET